MRLIDVTAKVVGLVKDAYDVSPAQAGRYPVGPTPRTRRDRSRRPRTGVCEDNNFVAGPRPSLVADVNDLSRMV